ncbi:MAG: S46 family peptidase [Rikenellaceae bacterium]
MLKAKRYLLLSLLVATSTLAVADQGMWLVNLVQGQLYEDMLASGLELSPWQIYSQEQLSIKDAVVAIDHGQCTGSIISAEGLMITNHHCAYGDIHAHSTLENNYLERGFWAATRTDEIPIAGKSVTFLQRVEDVTERIAIIADSLDRLGARGPRFMGKLEGVLTSQIDSEYELSLHSMWRGQRYYLYYYQTFEDVRLVGAPPVSIGAYGGEQDNWSWPQHKGDFTLYRVYTAPDGSPAKYSEQNIPMKAEKYLEISSGGYSEDDFAMILGYPGSTNRYSPSAELRERLTITNPVVSSVRRSKLNVWKEQMDRDPEVRLKYADKYFNVSNYCDFAKWENLCIEKFGIIEQREALEAELSEWIAQDSIRTAKYGTLLADFERLYEATAELVRNKSYIRETLVTGADITLLAQRLKSLRTHFRKSHRIDCKKHEAIQKFYRSNLISVFEQGDTPTDRELFQVMIETLFECVDMRYIDSELALLFAQFDFDATKFVEYIYSTSVIADRHRFEEFLSGEIEKSDIESDPMFLVANGINIMQLNKMEENICDSLNLSASELKSLYTEAIYTMQQEKGQAVYPDANSTMRITYGNIGGLAPRDGVRYHWQTTTDGVLAKHNAEDYEFCLLDEYKSLLEAGDWGRWAEGDKLYVNFLTNNDITGGNSGSSVLNSRGELIGLAFDGNRESMGGDLQFNTVSGKCVCVDIRYILWVIEKFGNAGHLIDEMAIK